MQGQHRGTEATGGARTRLPRRVRRIPFAAGLLAAALAGCNDGRPDDGASGQPPPVLEVTPGDGLASSGPVGGPFAPPSIDYTLTNTGGRTLTWTLLFQESWLTASSTGGSLNPGVSVVVTVSIDPVVAAALPAGVHTDVLEFQNLTNGSGDAVRDVELTVVAPPGLVVTPTTTFTSSGPQGGPFTPTGRIYTLDNTSGAPLDWSVSSSATWVTVSPKSGTLAPATQTTVTATIDATAAAAQPVGSHMATLSFVNETDGAGSTTRDVTLDVTSGGSPTAATSITQFGITWEFGGSAHTVGQFANGDWWVIGPVNITKIDPPSVATGERTMNGSMLNPSPELGLTQGYDSATYGQYRQPQDYDPALNVALGVSAAKPLRLQPGSSLVSTISHTTAGVRPQLRTAAVLTVLGTIPPAGSFRPPYVGTNKTIRFNEADLDYSKLARLPSVPSQPEWAQVERYFERPWIDHAPNWVGRYIHPSDNLPDYGREMADMIGQASLMLHLDYPDSKKRRTLVELVQVGIDFYAILDNGGQANWQAGDGHHSGRKWPILFAGLMLDDPAMSSIGFDPTLLFMGEDGQTFHVQETSPGVFNGGYGGYVASQVGLPEWGKKHALRPELDDADWLADPYRTCCTANSWWGELLAAYIMGGKPLWNHDALFEYQDRYLTESRARSMAAWQISWSPFPLEMWDTYRPSY